MGFEPFDEDEIDRLHPGQEIGQMRLRTIDFVQQCPATRGRDKDLVSSGEAVPMAVLPWLIHVETMMGVFDGGHQQTRSP